MQTLTLKQLVLGRPSWHCGTVMLMEAGRKMDTSTVTTGLVLEQRGGEGLNGKKKNEPDV